MEILVVCFIVPIDLKYIRVSGNCWTLWWCRLLQFYRRKDKNTFNATWPYQCLPKTWWRKLIFLEYFALRHKDPMVYFYVRLLIISMVSASTVYHYNDVLMSAMASKSPASALFAQVLIQVQIKGNIKTPRHWPLCVEFTGDRWIPRTKGQ